MYFFGDGDGREEEREQRAYARRTIDGAQSALMAIASLCVPDQIPLLGVALGLVKRCACSSSKPYRK